MRTEKRTVDLNAYIIDLRCDTNNLEDKVQLTFSFKNLNHGTITAVKLFCVAYDSFGDRIQFEGKEFYEVKKAGLQIKPLKKAGFSIEIEKCDIKSVEVSIAQIVYSDGEVVAPKEQKLIEYEIEVLSSSWSADDYFEKDALLIMREKNDKAICFPKIHPEGWICVCGTLNSESRNDCSGCGFNKEEVLRKFDKEIIKSEVKDRENKEQEETKRRAEQQKVQQKTEIRKKRRIVFFTASVVILPIIVIIAYVLFYNVKYGLSEEEKTQYAIAQRNYNKISQFEMEPKREFRNIVEEYDDGSYSYERKNRISEAHKNKDYIYARRMCLASQMLYGLIENQYPEKYQRVYNQLVELRKNYMSNDILTYETMYIQNGNASNLFDRGIELAKKMEIMQRHLDNDTLNPSKVKYIDEDILTSDYLKVYDISLGILFYEDRNIRYIGEVKNGRAHGFGKVWYSKEEGDGICCEGIFENGAFKSGSSYDIEGNKVSLSEMGDLVIEGEFEMVK